MSFSNSTQMFSQKTIPGSMVLAPFPPLSCPPLPGFVPPWQAATPQELAMVTINFGQLALG
jgi:hypothetical protein